MADKKSTTPNRRDWFRLFASSGSKSSRVEESTSARSRPRPPGQPAIGPAGSGLQPIAAPVNHDGMDLSTLPPMREAVLSAEEVQQLFADVATYATDVLLMERNVGRGRPMAGATDLTITQRLELACDGMLNNRLPRIQVRYHWSDTSWIDTLETRPDGYRLVRIAHR